jgi:hypothetical protein
MFSPSICSVCRRGLLGEELSCVFCGAARSAFPQMAPLPLPLPPVRFSPWRYSPPPQGFSTYSGVWIGLAASLLVLLTAGALLVVSHG